MFENTKLRNAGDFKNKSVVEYATIRVELLHRLVPSNLQDGHYRNDDIVKGLYATPTGPLANDSELEAKRNHAKP